MKKVTGQNLGMFWTKLCWTVLGQVNDLQMGNMTEDQPSKITVMYLEFIKQYIRRKCGK